jgi:outer membrane protein, heavy metal efflux system
MMRCLLKMNWLFLFTAAFALSVNAQAQSPTTNSAPPIFTLTLTQARETAFQRNWDLLAAKSGIDSATAQLIVAKEFPNPTLSITSARLGDTRAGTTIADGTMRNGIWSRSYDSIAAVSQLIEIAGKRSSRQTAARAGIIGARARFFDARRTLEQGVTKAYVAALLAENNLRILSESSGYLQHEAKIAQERYKAGDISDSDKKQIEINAEQYELQAKAAEAAAVQARIAVEILMSVEHPHGRWTPAESLDLLMTNSVPSPSDAITNAARTDILAAEADLRGGRANLQLQKSMRIPDPTFTVGYEHNPPDTDPPADTLNIGISFPLPLWNRNGGNIKAAKAAVDQFEMALGKVKTQAAADIANAETQYNEAYARWMRYRDITGPKSTKVRESIAFAYEKGGASLLDLLDAERTDNDVRLATALAMSDTASASADLSAAKAVMSETQLTSAK